MRKFEIGDRIVAYDANQKITGKVLPHPGPGFPGSVCVEIKEGYNKLFHEKQCRRLVKKERREWWIAFKKSGDFYNINRCTSYPKPALDPVHFNIIKVREVK